MSLETMLLSNSNLVSLIIRLWLMGKVNKGDCASAAGGLEGERVDYLCAACTEIDGVIRPTRQGTQPRAAVVRSRALGGTIGCCLQSESKIGERALCQSARRLEMRVQMNREWWVDLEETKRSERW